MKQPDNVTPIKICPLCGRAYTGYPAISRIDNYTPICSDCGIRQSLASIGVDDVEAEAILAIIHRHDGCTH